jgi:hypothetical protein
MRVFEAAVDVTESESVIEPETASELESDTESVVESGTASDSTQHVQAKIWNW